MQSVRAYSRYNLMELFSNSFLSVSFVAKPNHTQPTAKVSEEPKRSCLPETRWYNF